MMIRGNIAREIYDDESTMESTPEIVKSAISRPLKDLNLFIGFLKSKKPDCIDEFTQALVKRLKALTLDLKSNADFEYDSEHLSKYPELEEITKQVTLGMLNYSKYENNLKEESWKIPSKDAINSYVPTKNRMFTALVDVIERDEALAFCKEFVDYRFDFFKESIAPKIESLEQLYEGLGDKESSTYGAANAFLEGGMVVSRVNRCMWHELQKEFGDSEISYINSCHVDFHMTTKWIGDFELTRTKTLMQGDDCCDFVWHDKRMDKTMEHPSEEFWDNLK